MHEREIAPRREGMEPELKPVRTNDQVFGRGASYEAAREAVIAPSAQKVLRNTYLLLALTMVPTVIGAYIGMQTAGVIMASPIVSTLVLLAAVIGLQFGIAANRNSGIGIALQLLGYAALGTGAIFVGMGAIAATTKRDFSFMGKFLFVGMIALLVAMLANLWLQIPALALTISTLVVVVFSLFLLYDLQRIIRGGETNYIMAATGVYMSLFNIFANLLHLLMALAGERD